MNLFDNIIQSQFNNFTGKQAQPQVPSFSVPQAPRTTNYTQPVQPTAPVVQKPSMTLFSDEQKMFQRMKADNLSDDQSYGMLKKRRTDLLGGDGISADETKMLLRMQADNIPVKQAVAMIQKRRQDMAEKANSIHDLHADEGVVEQTLKAPFRAIGDVASQTWQGIGKGTEGLLDASFRGVNDLNKMIGSSDYSPELEKQLPQGGYLGDVAKIGAGTTGAVFNLGKAPLALGINTANQLPGAQYITQGIGKGIQYGAEQLGGLAGVDKETSMDLATTGMNLFGMKPGMNTLQYGKGIVNAPGVMGKAGAIVKPVGESVVQTVKMPYDIAKGTIKGGVNLAKKVGPSIATASDAIQTGLNRMTKGEINKFQAEQGVSPGKYLNDRNIVSSGKPIEETLLEQMKASRDQATAGTEAIVGNFKMPTKKFGDSEISYMREMLKDNYRHAKKTLDAEGTNQAKQLLDKYDTQGLTMGEINTAKRKMADNNPVNWNTDHASPRVQTVKRISDAVRNWQFDQAVKSGFTNLKEINKQTQAFYKLHEGITKWNDGIEANNKISLTDYLAFDADPSVFVAKKVLSSPYVRQGIVKGLNKISGRVVKPIEKATIDTINTKRAEYDYGNRNGNTGDRVVTGKQLALPAPSGKPQSAKVVNVKPMTGSPKAESAKGIIRDPRVKAQNDYLELKSLEESLSKGDEIMKSKARESFNKKIEQVKVEMDRAIYERVMSKEMKKIMRENYDSIYPQGMQTVFNKLKGYTKNKGNYNDIEGESGTSVLKKQFSDYTNEYNEKMGTNYTVNEMWDIFDDRYRKTPVKEIKKPIVKPNTIKNESVVPKKTVNAPIVKKSGVETKVDTTKYIFDEDTRKVLFEYQPKGYNVPKNADIYPSESGIGVSYKGKGRVDFYISTKDGKIKVSTENLGGNATDFIQDAWKRVGKDMESKLTHSSNAKQQVIKPKSTTTNVFGETIDKPSNKKGGFIKIPEIGKKVEPLIEEAKKYNSPNDAFGGKDVLYHGTTMDNLESIFKKGLLNIKDDKSSIKKIYLSSNIKDSERYTKIYPSKKPLLLAVKDSIEFGPEGSRGVRTDFMSTRTISPKEIAFRDDTTGKWVLLSDIYKTPVKNPIVKPNTIKNESKVSKPVSGDTTTNVFGETIKKPSNKKGGFIKIPEIGKKVEPLIEEAKKYKSVEEFVKAQGHGRKIIPIKGESMGQNTYKLSEVLDNKKLFEKYPELSGINVKFGWKPIGKEKMAIEGKNIVVTKSQYEIVPDTKKLAEIDKKLNELYKKDELGTITKEEYKTAEKLQQEYADIENGKGSSGIRLTDEGMRSLFHEIQHGKQALKGYNVKMQEDFLSENAIGDSKDYYQNLFEIDARRAEKKYKTVDELIAIYKQANKSKK